MNGEIPSQKILARETAGFRIPPNDIHAEKALLGALLLMPEELPDVLYIVTPGSFYSEKHRVIFSGILDLHAKNEPVDLLSLSSRLAEKGDLEGIGGRVYLADLTNAAPSSVNAEHYARIVQKKFMLRELIRVSERISALGYNEERDLEIVLDEAEKSVFNVTHAGSAQKFVSLRSTLDEAWERLDKLSKAEAGIRGVPTGFPGLDDRLAGLQKSDLIILAARPSMGKTALALDIARLTATKHQTPVGIFSLEMSSQQLVDRMIAGEAHVDAWKLRTGKLAHDDEYSRVRDSLDTLARAPIFIDDQPGNSILKMRSMARRMKTEHGLGLIIIDYLQLMTSPGNFRDSLVQQVTEISRSLKALARELDVPVLALSQLSRAVESRGGKPRLSDLRDSGSIEQDADVVMFIHRDDKYNESSEKPNIAEILIEKHRNGPTGKVELYFDERKATFLSIEGKMGGNTEAQSAAALSDEWGEF
ncbi:replicative DNA helicase [bacterium]|nr:replicative DNA helicase [bacterium]